MKKTRLLIIAFLTTTLAIAQTTFVDNNIQYKVLNATDVEVTSKTGGYTGSVTIPTTATDSNTNTTYDVTAIGELAFLSNSALTAVSIPNSVKTIGANAFNGAGLTTVTIPNSVTTIGLGAFNTCASLTSVSIGTSVTTIGDSAFGYSGLTSIAIPNSVTTVGKKAFNNCESLTSVTLPNTMTAIKTNTFDNCIKLTSITIPSSVITIGDTAFAQTGLTSITIPNSVTTIEGNAFSSCQDLTTVSIPNSVSTIGTRVFSYCTSLATVNVAHTMPLTIMADVFIGVTLGNVALNVPTGSKAAYEAAAVWQDFGTINATLSLSPAALAAALSVRYLPNQQLLHIETNGIAVQEVQFYDVTGRGLFSKALSTKKTIDVSSLQTGVYVVKIEGIAKKFVKY